MMKRKAAVAGSFYPGSEDALRAILRECIRKTAKETAVAVLSPHAGYVYSGTIAGAVYSRVAVPDAVILLGPPHRHPVPTAAMFPEGSWQTPLGNVPINEELASVMAANSRLMEKDAAPHGPEHSLEVQLPFLQHENPGVTIVPILVGTGRYEALRTIAEDIAKSVKEFDRDVLIVASSDMSHTDSSNPAKQQQKSALDRQALDRFIALDDKGFHDLILSENITMCGFAPATAAIIAAKQLGATSGELVDYRTSHDVSGDYSYVVGYGGAILR